MHSKITGWCVAGVVAALIAGTGSADAAKGDGRGWKERLTRRKPPGLVVARPAGPIGVVQHPAPRPAPAKAVAAASTTHADPEFDAAIAEVSSLVAHEAAGTLTPEAAFRLVKTRQMVTSTYPEDGPVSSPAATHALAAAHVKAHPTAEIDHLRAFAQRLYPD